MLVMVKENSPLAGDLSLDDKNPKMPTENTKAHKCDSLVQTKTQPEDELSENEFESSRTNVEESQEDGSLTDESEQLQNTVKELSTKEKEKLLKIRNEIVRVCGDGAVGGEAATTVDKLYSCELCGMQFSRQTLLKGHKKKHHDVPENGARPRDAEKATSNGVANGGGPFICTECNRSFECKRGLCRHKATHNKNPGPLTQTEEEAEHADPEWDCFESMEVCGGEEDENKKADEDEEEPGQNGAPQNVSSSMLFQCEYCKENFETAQGMKIHIARVHKKQREDELSKEKNEAHSKSIRKHRSEMSPKDNDAGGYTCPKCKKLFATKQACAGHVKVHLSRDADVVDQAPKRAAISQKKNAAGESVKLYNCPLCPRSFDSCYGYSGHMKLHKKLHKSKKTLEPGSVPSNRKRRRRDDSEASASSSNANADGDKMGPMKHFTCQYCQKRFDSPQQLSDHREMHRNSSEPNQRASFICSPATIEDYVYKCDACLRKFPFLSDLREHVNKYPKNSCRHLHQYNNSRQAEFSCPYCDQKFLLRCHYDTHLEMRCYANDLVDEQQEETTTSTGGETAVQSTTNADGKSKRVRSSTNINLLTQHEQMERTTRMRMKIENDAKALPVATDENEDYVEDLRTDFFVKNESIGVGHVYVFEKPTLEKSDSCHMCGESFSNRLQMMVHMASHMDTEKHESRMLIKAEVSMFAPIKCRFCKQRFCFKKYYLEHLRRRHSDALFICHFCDRLHTNKNNLKRHIRRHVMMRKYRCKYCKVAFSSKWFCRRHEKLHSGISGGRSQPGGVVKR